MGGDIWNADALPKDTLRSMSVPVCNGKLVLSVRGGVDGGHLLERRRWFPDGHLATQRLHIDGRAATLSAFIDWETSFPFPEQHYAPLRDVVPCSSGRLIVRGGQSGGSIRSDFQLIRALSDFSIQAKLSDCVFHAFILDGTERNVVLHDTLIAGLGPDSALWSQYYSNHELYRSDPVFAQAQRHNYQPVCASGLRDGRYGGVGDACNYPAFQSSAFFPARHEAALGILHVGSARSAGEGEAMFLDARARSSWTAFAHDILRDYFLNRRSEAIAKLAFTSLEHQIIALLVGDVKAAEIEERLCISSKALRIIRKSINQKMGLHDIRASINKIRSLGLVPMPYFHK
ncbi:TPA: helix-turn-helix transcriptional regulator [Burkholderia orbicola]|nr:LuxR family transcriptional regulator [Burkholderia cenocepacia]